MFTVYITSDNLVKVRHHWTTYSDECGQDYVVLIRRINLHFYNKRSSGLEGPVSHTRWQTTEKETREGSLEYWYYRALAGGGRGGDRQVNFRVVRYTRIDSVGKNIFFHRKTGSLLATIGSGIDQIHRKSITWWCVLFHRCPMDSDGHESNPVDSIRVIDFPMVRDWKTLVKVEGGLRKCYPSLSYGIRWTRIESSVLHRNDRFSAGEAEVESVSTIVSNCDARDLIEKKISHQFMETSTLPNNIL